MNSRKVIVELDDGTYLTMDESGNVRAFVHANHVTNWVRRRDRQAARRGVSTTTIIEWRNMPDGFVPPLLDGAAYP